MLVRVGSRNETPKEYGLAHYLEHMLFKGNRTFPKYLDLNKKIDSLQGETNASTHKNMTMYYIKLPGKINDNYKIRFYILPPKEGELGYHYDWVNEVNYPIIQPFSYQYSNLNFQKIINLKRR